MPRAGSCATIAGKRCDIGVGSLKVVSLAGARAEAGELRRQMALGIDPIAERKKVVDPPPTFREAAARLHEEQKARWKKRKHQGRWILRTLDVVDAAVTQRRESAGRERVDRQPRTDGHFLAMPFGDVPTLVKKLHDRSSVGRLALGSNLDQDGVVTEPILAPGQERAITIPGLIEVGP